MKKHTQLTTFQLLLFLSLINNSHYLRRVSTQTPDVTANELSSTRGPGWNCLFITDLVVAARCKQQACRLASKAQPAMTGGSRTERQTYRPLLGGRPRLGGGGGKRAPFLRTLGGPES